MIPSGIKEGKLYSFRPNDGTGDFTVDRNSTATYVDEDGLIKTALANVPRIEDGAILVEPQSANFVRKSETIDYSYWNYQSESTTTTTINTTSSPDGLFNGDKLIPNIDSDENRTGIGVVNPLDYQADQFTIITISSFLKIGGYKIVDIGGNFGDESALINLDSKIVISQESNVIRTNIITLEDDWVRVSVTYSFQNNIGNGFLYTGIRIKKDDGSSSGYDGTSGVYIWGTQIEVGELTSYIPTNGTTVTRLADNISVSTPAGVTAITETIDGVEQTPITTIPTTYSLPVGNINKVTML